MALRIISVLTAYKRPFVVQEAMESIAAQTRRPDQLIVVDDASDNDTPDRIAGWLQAHDLAFPARLVVQPTNRGAGAARNRGVDEAGPCDVITFLDDDDLWPEDYLQRVEQAFQEHPAAIVACCDRLNINVQTGREQLRSPRGVERNAPAALLSQGLPGIPNTSYRSAPFLEAGGFNPQDRIAEDYPIMLRLSLRGDWVYIPGSPVTVRRATPDHTTGVPRLSKSREDGRQIVARMIDRFIHAEEGEKRIDDAIWRPVLGHMWFAAGRQLQACGRRPEAADCYRKALALQPWRLRARFRLWTLRP